MRSMRMCSSEQQELQQTPELHEAPGSSTEHTAHTSASRSQFWITRGSHHGKLHWKDCISYILQISVEWSCNKCWRVLQTAVPIRKVRTHSRPISVFWYLSARICSLWTSLIRLVFFYYLVRHLCGTWCLLPLSSCTLQITFRWKVNVLVSFYPHYTAYQFTSKWSIFSPYRCKSSSSTTRKETCFGGILWKAWSLRSSLNILHGEMFYRSNRFCGKASWIRILHNIYLKFLRTIVLLPFRYFFSYVGRLMLSSLNHCTVRLTGDSKNSGYKR